MKSLSAAILVVLALAAGAQVQATTAKRAFGQPGKLGVPIAQIGHQSAYTPDPGSSERTAIMDQIRSISGSSSRMIVEHLKIARANGISVAYAEVRSEDDRFSGWVFLTTTSGEWSALWAVEFNGASDCADLNSIQRMSLSISGTIGAAHSIFSKQFIDDYVNSAASADDTACVGEIIPAQDEGR